MRVITKPIFLVAFHALCSVILSSCDPKSQEPTIDEPNVEPISIPALINTTLPNIHFESNNDCGFNATYEVIGSENHSYTLDAIESFKLNGFDVLFNEPDIISLPISNNSSLQEYTADMSLKSYFKKENTKTELPSKLKDIYSAQIQRVSSFSFTIQNPSVNAAGIEEINIKDITIQFPDFITLKDGSNKLYINSLVLNESNNFHNYFSFRIQDIIIDKKDQDKYITEENGKKYISFEDVVNFNAQVSIKYFPSNIQNPNICIDLGQSANDYSIQKVNGATTHNIHINNAVSITNIPDFIKDKNISSSCDDIMFQFTYTNSSQSAFDAHLDITPWDTVSNAATGAPISISLEDNYCIKRDNKTTYIISNKPYSTSSYDTINIVNEDLANLLHSDSRTYKITSTNITNNNKYSNMFTLGTDYTLNANYNAIAKYSLSNININHTETIENISYFLKKHTKDTDKIQFVLNGYNTLPMDIEANIEAYDSYNNKLDELTIIGDNSNNITIKSSNEKDIKFSQYKFTIQQEPGCNQLEKIDKIVLKFKAKNNNNKEVTLGSSQRIYIPSIIASFPK